jgi:hypothetical protein
VGGRRPTCPNIKKSRGSGTSIIFKESKQAYFFFLAAAFFFLGAAFFLAAFFLVAILFEFNG